MSWVETWEHDVLVFIWKKGIECDYLFHFGISDIGVGAFDSVLLTY